VDRGAAINQTDKGLIMEPKECLKKAKELVDAYEKLNIPSDYEFPVILLFVKAICVKWTVKITTNSID